MSRDNIADIDYEKCRLLAKDIDNTIKSCMPKKLDTEREGFQTIIRNFDIDVVYDGMENITEKFIPMLIEDYKNIGIDTNYIYENNLIIIESVYNKEFFKRLSSQIYKKNEFTDLDLFDVAELYLEAEKNSLLYSWFNKLDGVVSTLRRGKTATIKLDVKPNVNISNAISRLVERYENTPVVVNCIMVNDEPVVSLIKL